MTFSMSLSRLVQQLLRRGRPSGRRSWLPPTIYPDDAYIVSYPKSGNTWVRFLLANVLKPPDVTIDFHTVDNYVPEVGRHNEVICKLARPRFMKTHALHTPEYPKVVYVVRDGRDVYVSYYYHRLHRLAEGTTFSEFLRREDHFPCLWGQHVQSWLGAKSADQHVLFVKYEDLYQNCAEQLRRIVLFLGLESTADRFNEAVQVSSFDCMRRAEIEHGRPAKGKDGPDLFVRKGQPGNWQEHFAPADRAFFKSREGAILIELGYELDDHW